MRSRLATRMTATVAGVVLLGAASSVTALVAAWSVGDVLERTVDENVRSIRDAEELGGALLDQKGLVARYLLSNGDRVWLEKLDESEPKFAQIVADIRNTTHVSPEEADLLGQLETTYARLDARRKEMIAVFQNDNPEKAKELLLTAGNDDLYETAYNLCLKFVAASNRDVRRTTDDAMAKIGRMTWAVGICVVLTVALGAMLLWMLFYRVLIPLRGMVADARLFRDGPVAGDRSTVEDELRAVGDYLRGLMSDVADTRNRLERSRSRLLAAEKLASVGKLAASVAHEIRNPLTAMKMWLFSIRESAQGNPDLERKVRIVSEEVARLEGIIGSFLEFSRPRAPKRRAKDVGEVLGQTLELLAPRLHQKRIRVTRKTPPALPLVLVDPEQLKQVLLNLLANSTDAIGEDGEIRISAAAERDVDDRPMVVVRIRDTGPGMPKEVQSRIFEPFFSTKEQGTGLGLCIAAQIMARHEGSLVLESSTPQGTTFAVWTPAAPPDTDGKDPDR